MYYSGETIMEDSLNFNTRGEKILTQTESVNELFHKNEIEANQLVALTMMLISVCLFIAWGLDMAGMFQIDKLLFTVCSFTAIIFLCISAAINRKYKGDRTWIKYFLMTVLIVVLGMLDSILTYNLQLIILFPLVLSLRYYSDRYTLRIAIVSALVFTCSAAVSARFMPGIYDLNFIDVAQDTLIPYGTDPYLAMMNAGGFEQSKYFYFYMTQSLIPKLIQYAIFTVIAYMIAKFGRQMVAKQAEISAESSRIDSELSVARSIQADMLPYRFPAFPDRDEFDVYATMTPAKQVGGDFYDFFMVDDSHVAVVMADVSGKGVPAALFMAIAKAMIKDHTEPEKTLDQTFFKVNNMLFESNSEGMFVTAFEGVLDLVTGELIFVNAGHESPYICRNGKTFEFYKVSPGLVLAGFDNFVYKTASIQLEPGDKLFQYTDGVTDAVNAEKEFFGQERLTESLERNSLKSPFELLSAIHADIDDFVGAEPQFDDITMLCLEYKKKMKQ